jgi:hypothetical protein
MSERCTAPTALRPQRRTQNRAHAARVGVQREPAHARAMRRTAKPRTARRVDASLISPRASDWSVILPRRRRIDNRRDLRDSIGRKTALTAANPSLVLEELHCALVFLRRRARFERAEIPTLARLGILLSRVQPVLTALEFANHTITSEFSRRCPSCVSAAGRTACLPSPVNPPPRRSPCA